MPLHNANEHQQITEIDEAFGSLVCIITNPRLSIKIKRNALERFDCHYAPYEAANPHGVLTSFITPRSPVCLVCATSLVEIYGICHECMQKRFPALLTKEQGRELDFYMDASIRLTRIHSYFNPLPLDNKKIP